MKMHRLTREQGAATALGTQHSIRRTVCLVCSLSQAPFFTQSSHLGLYFIELERVCWVGKSKVSGKQQVFFFHLCLMQKMGTNAFNCTAMSPLLDDDIARGIHPQAEQWGLRLSWIHRRGRSWCSVYQVATQKRSEPSPPGEREVHCPAENACNLRCSAEAVRWRFSHSRKPGSGPKLIMFSSS